MTAAEVKRIAHRCGFELAGVAAALPNADFPRYRSSVDQGHAGGMSYLADRPRGRPLRAAKFAALGTLASFV